MLMKYHQDLPRFPRFYGRITVSIQIQPNEDPHRQRPRSHSLTTTHSTAILRTFHESALYLTGNPRIEGVQEIRGESSLALVQYE